MANWAWGYEMISSQCRKTSGNEPIFLRFLFLDIANDNPREYEVDKNSYCGSSFNNTIATLTFVINLGVSCFITLWMLIDNL